MNQSSQGTKASNAHDAVPMFCEHPLKILKAKTIKFWYNEGQLVSVPKGHFPLPRHWTRDCDFGLATRDIGPATRDPRPATISQTQGQLVSVPKGQCMDRLSKEYKRR